MAKEKPMIVIKKITVAGGGHHGGSWKVALADFMTAMTAFFLVMWLLGQSEATKKAVSDYFSTPSIIEYNFQNYGAQITLEKLFLDLINEPMKAFESFLEPMDKTPNLLDMGSEQVVASFLKDHLNELSSHIEVLPNGFFLEFPETVFFKKGTDEPGPEFVKNIDKIKKITAGLESSKVEIKSVVTLGIMANPDKGESVAQSRLKLIMNSLQSNSEHQTVIYEGNHSVVDTRKKKELEDRLGFIRLSISQDEFKSDGTKYRPLETVFSESKKKNVYDRFVEKASGPRKKISQQPKNSSSFQ